MNITTLTRITKTLMITLTTMYQMKDRFPCLVATSPGHPGHIKPSATPVVTITLYTFTLDSLTNTFCSVIDELSPSEDDRQAAEFLQNPATSKRKRQDVEKGLLLFLSYSQASN